MFFLFTQRFNAHCYTLINVIPLNSIKEAVTWVHEFESHLSIVIVTLNESLYPNCCSVSIAIQWEPDFGWGGIEG